MRLFINNMNFKLIGKILMILAVLFSIGYFISGTLFTPAYAPPEIMRENAARKAQEAIIILSSIGIIFVAGIASFLYGKKSPEKKQ